MKRLSKVIVPAKVGGNKEYAFMHLSVHYGTARFSVLMFRYTENYKYVEFLEDEEEGMMFALFNNKEGYQIRANSYKEKSKYHCFASKALTQYWVEKYSITEKTANFVCSIGVAEQTEEGFKVPIFYQKPRTWK